MNINRRKQLSRLINDLTPEISKRKIFLNFQQSFHFSTNVLIIEQRNKNFLEYFRNSYTFTSELLKRRKKSKCKKNSFDQNVEKRKECPGIVLNGSSIVSNYSRITIIVTLTSPSESFHPLSFLKRPCFKR